MPQPRDQLSASDALLWRIEADPVLRSPIVVVGLLDRAPSWDRVRSVAARAVAAVPRLRCRITPDGPFGHPVWEDDPRFDVDNHVRRIALPEPGGMAAVLDAAAPDAAAAFDPARPPWSLVVVEGLEGGRAAFVLRFHHAISDGVGAVELADELFDRSRRGGRRKATASPDGADATRRTPLTDAAAGLLRLAADPLGTARRGIRFARSVGHLLEGAPTPLSPLLRERSVDRHLAALEIPLAALRRAAGAAGGTVNDVFLAAVGGALRRYHDERGSPLDAIRLTVPINLRTEGDEAGGNHFAPARFVLPVDDPDPVRRAKLAGALVRRWRAEPALGALSALAAVLDLLPTGVLVRLFGGMLRGVDVDAVDVPGLRHDAYFAGAKVERLWAFAPPTGAAVSVTLLSHGETACVGVAADTAAVDDPGALVRCVEAALEEVAAA